MTPLLRRYRFVATFAAIFAAGQLATVTSRTYIADWLVAAPARWTLPAFFPGDSFHVTANHIASARAQLNILPGCEGTELFLLLIAGVLAFPTGWRQRFWGLSIGLAFAFALNQLRVAILYGVVRDHARLFNLVHGYVAPTALVVCLGAFYGLWTATQTRR
jgi:exosortase family protein XrtM